MCMCAHNRNIHSQPLNDSDSLRGEGPLTRSVNGIGFLPRENEKQSIWRKQSHEQQKGAASILSFCMKFVFCWYWICVCMVIPETCLLVLMHLEADHSNIVWERRVSGTENWLLCVSDLVCLQMKGSCIPNCKYLPVAGETALVRFDSPVLDTAWSYLLWVDLKEEKTCGNNALM